MIALEMKKEFLLLYDKFTNFSAPGYEDEEISILLTKAQERVVLKIYNPSGNKYKEGFEETEGRRKDLDKLIKGTNITVPSASQTEVLPNGVFYDLPEDCLFAISEEVTTVSEDPCKNNKRVRVKPFTHDEYSINIKNPFKKPSIRDFIWRLDYTDRKHELITDGTFSIGTYHLRYIKNLSPIIIGSNTVNGVAGPLDCELNTVIHSRIVDEAVKMAVGITDPELYQIKTIEQQGGE